MSKTIQVKKSNELARSGFQLSLIEYRFINICTGSIFYKDHVSSSAEYYVSIDDYSKRLSITEKEAKSQFRIIKKCLPLREVRIKELDNDPIPWISEAGMYTSDEIFVKFDPDIIEYLFGLTENFISYDFQNILLLDSQHAIRLYEIIKTVAHEYAKFRLDVSVDELKWMMGLDEKYKDYGSFKRLLTKCLTSINKHTDINATFIERKLDKAVKKLVFSVTEKIPRDRLDKNFDTFSSPEFLEAIDWRSRGRQSSNTDDEDLQQE